MFVLTIYDGDSGPKAHRFEPDSDTYTIGRGPSCDRVLTSNYVSRVHCNLVRTENDWILYDGNPQADGWAARQPMISVGHMSKKTIAMLPGMIATLIEAKGYRVTLEREREGRVDTTDGVNRDTIAEEKLTPGLLVSILDEFVESLKPIINPLVDSNAVLIESNEVLISRVSEVDARLANESIERKDVDRKSDRDLHSLNKMVMYGAGILLAVSVYSLTRGDKEITNKVIDLLIAVISSGLLIKTVAPK